MRFNRSTSGYRYRACAFIFVPASLVCSCHHQSECPSKSVATYNISRNVGTASTPSGQIPKVVFRLMHYIHPRKPNHKYIETLRLFYHDDDDCYTRRNTGRTLTYERLKHEKGSQLNFRYCHKNRSKRYRRQNRKRKRIRHCWTCAVFTALFLFTLIPDCVCDTVTVLFNKSMYVTIIVIKGD